MNILLLEDDPKTSAFVAQGLEEAGHCVSVHTAGENALREALDRPFDILVLDRMVRGMDGLTVLTQVRAHGCQTPTIMLTALARVEDRVVGLQAGADDYLVKPFAFAELAARITALARRPPLAEAAAVLRVGDLEMDVHRREVRRGGRHIDLQPREFSLLEQLMRNPDRVVTRTMLLDRVWNLGFDPRTNIVESHMSRLRAKLSEGFATQPIRTVRGSGYILAPDDR
ncbi:response regulator transcription factor [Phenylobacterium sp.]|uniref:response regulator transcription factor n=1 Tax=Phenylobacterium sp. TaxID=1871053 RepID=UPI0025F6ED30|nr:response regulator transcription factor [Phenylobacterium sp.]MBX3484714.1 response regulator transcription factor [Phenylobacterium sp.]MCW5758862.1 response regulator transcription factor [Phenylobacterium sp.]